MYNFDIGSLEKVHCVFIGAIGCAVYNTGDTGVDQDFCAVDARQMSDITHRAFGGDSVQSGLYDGVRLRVDGADTVPVYHEVTDLVAMSLPGRGAVEAGGEDAFFEHKHTANEGAVTGAAFGNCLLYTSPSPRDRTRSRMPSSA